MQFLSKDDIRKLFDEKLGTPIPSSNFYRAASNNDFSDIKAYSGKPGIYHFIDLDGNSLYVGTAGYGKKQGLSERVAQNFAKSSGGTLRKKVARQMFNDDQDLAITWLFDNTRLQLAETPSKEHSELERLKPKFNG